MTLRIAFAAAVLVSLTSLCRAQPNAADDDASDNMHADLYKNNPYPSARDCGRCHMNHYEQWSVSQHAYAQLSPVFNSMHAVIVKRTNGTFGDFCIRCHTPVGMQMGEPIFGANEDRHPTSREGITCIVCHRVDKAFGKISGRIPIGPGDVTVPIQGPTGDNTQIQKVLKEGLATDQADKSGRKIHGGAHQFFQLTTSAFCATCHDVTFVNGFRLEEAFSHYKASPAAKKGISCQDCHMGKEPGVFTGDPKTNYEFGPAARVGGEWTRDRKLTNHMIVGPDYSIVHPALFPFTTNAIKEKADKDNPAARGMATISEWLQFDYKAGWGTDKFEDDVKDDAKFPERWRSVDDRYDARALIERNMKLLDKAREARLKLLRNGYKLGEVEVDQASDARISFRIKVYNGTEGHAVPTGFDADRLVWLHTVVKDRVGRVVLESGDLDPNGDVRDLHSAYVKHGELPLDEQLLTLQSKFLVTNVRGSEKEAVLAINHSVSPLPFARPERRSSVLVGQPVGARKHRGSISPDGHREGEYTLKGDNLLGSAPYTISVELKAAMVPVNLVNEVKEVGFDYNMSARDVAEAVIAGHEVLWRREMQVPASAAE